MSILRTILMVDDIDLLWEYLTNLDFIGFITACYTTRLGEAFYAILMLMVSMVIFIRSKNLTYCIILWLLVGSLGFLVAVPQISSVAVMLMVLGIVGLIYKLVFK